MPRKAEIPIILSNGKQAGQTINELRQQANKLTKELNNMKRGSEEFARTSADLDLVGKELSDIRAEAKGVGEANNGLISQFQHFIPFSGQLQSVNQGFKAVNLSLKGTRAALIATGVGAFVVILGSLISYLTTTQAGMDKLNAVIRPLKATFEVFKGVVQELGEKVFAKFSAALDDPIGALKDLGQAILDNIINRFKALSLIGPALVKIFKGDLAEGFKELGNAGIQLSTGITDGLTKAAEAASFLSEKVEEGIAAGTKLDQLQKQIELTEISVIKRRRELEAQAKQLNFIVEDETKTLQEREAAALGALAAQKELQEIQLQLIDLKIEKMKLEQTLNDTSREDLKELAELEASRSEIIASVTEMETTTRNKLNILRKAQAAQEQKELAEKMKAEEEARKIQLEAERNLQDLKIQLMEEGVNKEIEKLWLDTERKIEALTGTEEQITQQKIALEQARTQQIEEIRDAQVEKEKQRQQELANFERSLANVRMGTALSITNFLAQQLAARVGDEKDAQNILKAAAIAEIGFNLQQELSANAVTAAANPLNAVTFGAAGAAQLTALNTASIVRAGIGVATVLSSNLGGGASSASAPPSATGRSTVGASSISQASTQGVSFSSNATAAPANNIGARAQQNQSSESSFSQSFKAGIEERILQAIQNWPTTLEVNQNLQEVERGLKVLDDTRKEADF